MLVMVLERFTGFFLLAMIRSAGPSCPPVLMASSYQNERLHAINPAFQFVNRRLHLP